jgi:outer membrane cobalamin receptor
MKSKSPTKIGPFATRDECQARRVAMSGHIERAEVLDGGQALFYGTQAVAGAVN